MRVKFARNWLFLCSLVAVGASLLMLVLPRSEQPAVPVITESVPPPEAEIPEIEVERVEGRFSSNSTLQEVFLDQGFSRQEIHALITDVRPVYNFNQVRAGNRFVIERLLNGAFNRLEYHINDEEYLVVEYQSGHYTAARNRHQFRVSVEELYGEIQYSLWNTLVSQGETPLLSVSLYEILQWDVDFTSIQPRDSVKLIVEKKYLDEKFVKYGDILAVQFNSGGQVANALLFGSPGSTGSGYYDEKGDAVRKAFLKVPFNFDPRVTSRFSHSRYHPILKKRRPHLGVDYGAPTGTPVLASASGTVVFAGRDGGYGNLLKIRHPNGYVTSYAHLSRIQARNGQKVSQGQQVAQVGSTGLSTGPHLDYRVQDKRGRFINPQKVSALPSDKPVDKRYWKEFVEVRDGLLTRLDSIPEAEPFLSRVSHAD